MINKKPTKHDIINLYKYFLKREPESNIVISDWLKNSPSLDWLIDQFTSCSEFEAIRSNNLNKLTELDSLVKVLAQKHPEGELYQPIFGANYKFEGPIQRECQNRAELVIDLFKDFETSNMSVIDVGTNMGYIAFYLADHFGRVSGVELDDDLFNFCIQLNKILKTKVSFDKLDFFKSYSKLSGFFDICLMFSVIHYLVASEGIDESRIFLNNIANSFQYVVIEMSTVIDYEYMPANPTALFSKLKDIKITEIGTSEKNKRKIYLLEKKK